MNRPPTPVPSPPASLRTPSVLYNHGGYYGPVDPKMCNAPGGPCIACQQRIDECAACATRPPFLEPCPSCSNVGSYKTHAEHNVTPTCHGCEEKVCIECWHGARYTCRIVSHNVFDAPTTASWTEAELVMRQDPALAEVVAYQHGEHVYKVVRAGNDLMRIHEIR